MTKLILWQNLFILYSFLNQNINVRKFFKKLAFIVFYFVAVLYPVLSIDWSPGDDAAKLCENLKEDDFGPDLYVQQGIN